MVSGLLYITIAVAQLFRVGTFMETTYSYPNYGINYWPEFVGDNSILGGQQKEIAEECS